MLANNTQRFGYSKARDLMFIGRFVDGKFVPADQLDPKDNPFDGKGKKDANGKAE